MTNKLATRTVTSINDVVFFEIQNHEERQLYPYDLDHMLEGALKQFAVNVPFKVIVDKSMGISTCPSCGSRYVGEQGKCTRFDYFYSVEWQRDTYKSFEKAKERHSYYSPEIKGKEQLCNNDTRWDLASEFYEQSRFFSTLRDVFSVTSSNGLAAFESGIMKYKDNIAPGLAEKLEMAYLQNTVSMLSVKVDMHHNAIQEIADRMKAAGGQLAFGGNF